MERFSDLLLLLAGTAIGAYALFPGSRGGETSLEKNSFFSAPAKEITLASPDSQSIAPTRYVPADPVRTDEGVRTFSPKSPAFREVMNLASADTAVLNTDASSGGWTSVVTAAPARSHVLRMSKSKDGATHFELTRDLQRGLKKAGCYGGEINGRWTNSTKAAMAAFMTRVNATLPAEKPDYVLLSLVEAHGGAVCMAECPSGQARGKSGQCIPQAVVARVEQRPERRRPLLPATSKQTPKQQQAVAAAAPEKLPWLQEAQTAARDVASTGDAPFPGRMSIGGPMAATAPTRSAVSKLTTNPVPLNSDDADDPAAVSVAELPPDSADPGDDSDAEAAEAARESNWKRSNYRAQRASVSRSRRHARSHHRRRGDPRPGSMRYNVARVLGGIY